MATSDHANTTVSRRSFLAACAALDTVATHDGDLDAVWREAFGEGQLLPVGTRSLIAQGVLVLREFSSGQCEVVSGPEIQGCRKALVAMALVEPFIHGFSGTATRPRTQPSLVNGWVEVEGCEVRQVDYLPKGLEAVTQLLRTMSPPSVTLVGGVHTPGGFLLVPNFLPSVRAPDVGSMYVVFGDGGSHPCIQSVDKPGEWILPKSVDQPGLFTLRASWSIRTEAGPVERTSDKAEPIHLAAYGPRCRRAIRHPRRLIRSRNLT